MRSRRSFYLATALKSNAHTQNPKPLKATAESGKWNWLPRMAAHAALAVFVAMAANKFFVADLDFELEHGFYARIFQFHGDAPDQYRILPLLPLKFLCGHMPFNHAVLLYNIVLGWVVLELLWRMGRHLTEAWQWGLSFGYAILYIYLQYTGWRPDTMGLMAICLAAALVLRDLQDRSMRWLIHGVYILLLSFSRAEIALVYALFATFYRNKSYAAWIPVPIVLQVLMREVIFPDAPYYSKTFMLQDNLNLHYLLHQPASYLLLALGIVFWKPVLAFVSGSFRKNSYFYLLSVGYVILILLIGRLNEYRLYLPFLPLLLSISHGSRPAQGKQ